MFAPTILIPAAGLGRRMKSFGPKCLIPIRDEPLILRQLRILGKVFPSSEIVVVLGYQAEKVRKVLPPHVTSTVNPFYETTNVAHSIQIGLRRCRPDRPVLLVYGDLAFNEEDVAVFHGLQHSSLLTDSRGGRIHEVGVNVVEGWAAYFSYSLPVKWGHVALLHPPEHELFIRISSERNRRKQFAFEIFNEIVDRGGGFWAVEPPQLNLVEIDTSRNLLTACKIVR